MKKALVTSLALALLALSAFAAVHATSHVREACLPPAMVQAWS